MSEISIDTLENMAKLAAASRDKAYAPYSNHPVGAAILDDQGQIHGGCNIEMANYKGFCAEGCAISHMILAGGTAIKAVVVSGPTDAYLCTPCGDCRQRIREFSTPDTPIYSYFANGQLGQMMTMEELLPSSFGPENLTEVQG